MQENKLRDERRGIPFTQSKERRGVRQAGGDENFKEVEGGFPSVTGPSASKPDASYILPNV